MACERSGSGPMFLKCAAWGVPVSTSTSLSSEGSIASPTRARCTPITAAAALATMGVADEVPPNESVYHWWSSPLVENRDP